jgi:hypothetical protein
MTRLLAIMSFVIALGLPQPCLASPIVISYQAIDLADPSPAEDRWEYRYVVSDFAFAADQGFSVAFDPAFYTALSDPAAAVNADWDVLTFQPDVTLTSPGLYDALALAGGASLTDPFVVEFTWLGAAGTTPGSQPFSVNAYDASGMLIELETGVTVPLTSAVPEPATALLLALGGAAALRHSRRPHGGSGRRP